MNELTQKIRILIADDHALFRSGIKRLLNDDKDIFLVGEAQNGDELVNKYFELKPDLILVDISMPNLSGTDAITKIKKTDKNAKALFLSMHDEEEFIYYILKAGGLGLINKNIMQGELLYAIRQVNEGKLYFGAGVDHTKLKEIQTKYDNKYSKIFAKDELSLTDRQKEILIMIGQGLSSEEIAVKLNLSRRTIDTHRIHLMQKLDIDNLPKLMRYAVEYTNKLQKK